MEKFSVSVIKYYLLYTEKQLLHGFYKCEEACAHNCKYFSISACSSVFSLNLFSDIARAHLDFFASFQATPK